jgi:hypothetical protein
MFLRDTYNFFAAAIMLVFVGWGNHRFFEAPGARLLAASMLSRGG